MALSSFPPLIARPTLVFAMICSFAVFYIGPAVTTAYADDTPSIFVIEHRAVVVEEVAVPFLAFEEVLATPSAPCTVSARTSMLELAQLEPASQRSSFRRATSVNARRLPMHGRASGHRPEH